MPINPFFNFYNNKQEQNLVEDLINESLSMFGFEAYYVPRDSNIKPDLLYGDEPLKSFTNAFPIHVYMYNSADPGMNNDFFSKFGLEIKNNVKVILSKRVFERMVLDNVINRPLEGDLLYIPWLSGTGELYEIKYTNDSSDFFVLGRKYPFYWQLELELFKYSHEEIETGIPEINTVSDDHSFSILYEMKEGNRLNYAVGETVIQNYLQFFDENDNIIIVEVLADKIKKYKIDNTIETIPITANMRLDFYTESGEVAMFSMLSTAKAIVKDWNAITQTLRISNVIGEFNDNSYIIGLESKASYKVAVYNPIDIPSQKDSTDNYNIQAESSLYIDKSISNPFGLL